jgi:hypothetical protein
VYAALWARRRFYTSSDIPLLGQET